MMPAAPDLFPPLDDALRALDGFPGRPADVATARAFLERLDQVRDVPAVVLNREQAERMEGAYLAGVRCADESGHVLVMSLPVFLELCPPPAASWRDRARDFILERPFLWLAVLFATGEAAAVFSVAVYAGHQPVLPLALIAGAVYLDALLKLRKKGSK